MGNQLSRAKPSRARRIRAQRMAPKRGPQRGPPAWPPAWPPGHPSILQPLPRDPAGAHWRGGYASSPACSGKHASWHSGRPGIRTLPAGVGRHSGRQALHVSAFCLHQTGKQSGQTIERVGPTQRSSVHSGESWEQRAQKNKNNKHTKT